MRKLWQLLKNAAAALAGRTSAPAPAGGGEEPGVRPVENKKPRGGSSASGAPARLSKPLKTAGTALASLSRFTSAHGGAPKIPRATAIVQKAGTALAIISRFTSEHGGGAPKSLSAAPAAQKAGRNAGTAKFTARRNKSAPPQALQKAAGAGNPAAPQFEQPARISEAPPNAELTACRSAPIESAATTVTPDTPVIDASLVNEILSLQYRRCASSIEEQEVL